MGVGAGVWEVDASELRGWELEGDGVNDADIEGDGDDADVENRGDGETGVLLVVNDVDADGDETENIPRRGGPS